MSMFENDTYEDDDDTEDGQQAGKVSVDRSHLRALEKKGRKADRAELLERQIAALKLGIDIESPGGKLLLSHADAPWDKPEELKALAISINALKVEDTSTTSTESTSTETTADEDELGQSSERSDLSNGATGDTGAPREDPREVAMTQAKDALKKGVREEEALGHFFNRIAEAGSRGDDRVVIR